MQWRTQATYDNPVCHLPSAPGGVLFLQESKQTWAPVLHGSYAEVVSAFVEFEVRSSRSV
jgi:hypothetical protein